MSSTAKCLGLGLLLVGLSTIRAEALTVPFAEDFSGSTAAWKNNANTDLTLKSGGPDGDYVSTDFTFGTATSQTPVIVRAQSNFSSSNNAFFGDWVAGGATKLRVNVRHNDANGSLPIFARLSLAPAPGIIFGTSTLVPANQWTLLEFDIQFNNPLISFESAPTLANYNAVMTAVARLQFGVTIPDAELSNMTPITFDVDRVSVVPEPTSLLLAVVGAAVAISWAAWRKH